MIKTYLKAIAYGFIETVLFLIPPLSFIWILISILVLVSGNEALLFLLLFLKDGISFLPLIVFIVILVFSVFYLIFSIIKRIYPLYSDKFKKKLIVFFSFLFVFLGVFFVSKKIPFMSVVFYIESFLILFFLSIIFNKFVSYLLNRYRDRKKYIVFAYIVLILLSAVAFYLIY